jgi:integrase
MLTRRMDGGAVAKVLRRHKSRQALERLAAPAWQDNDLVFPSSVGTIMYESNLRREFAKLTDAAGIRIWTPYELRRSAITLLSEEGIANEEIADLAGHADTRMVMKHYRHITKPIDAGPSTLDHLTGHG